VAWPSRTRPATRGAPASAQASPRSWPRRQGDRSGRGPLPVAPSPRARGSRRGRRGLRPSRQRVPAPSREHLATVGASLRVRADPMPPAAPRTAKALSSRLLRLASMPPPLIRRQLPAPRTCDAFPTRGFGANPARFPRPATSQASWVRGRARARLREAWPWPARWHIQRARPWEARCRHRRAP